MLGISLEQTLVTAFLMIVCGVWSYTMKKMDDCIRDAKEEAWKEHDKRREAEQKLDEVNNYMASLLNVPGVSDLFQKALDEIPDVQEKLKKETEDLKSELLTRSNTVEMNTTCISQLEDTKKAVRYVLFERRLQ